MRMSAAVKGTTIWDNDILARNAAVSRNGINGFSLMGEVAVVIARFILKVMDNFILYSVDLRG